VGRSWPAANLELQSQKPDIQDDLVGRGIDRKDLCLVDVENASCRIDETRGTEGRQLERLRQRNAREAPAPRCKSCNERSYDGIVGYTTSHKLSLRNIGCRC
jgi:hypothetical protein